jgi:hypothetical protein
MHASPQVRISGRPGWIEYFFFWSRQRKSKKKTHLVGFAGFDQKTKQQKYKLSLFW